MRKWAHLLTFSLSLVLFFSINSNAQSLKEGLKLTDNEQYELAADVYKALIAKEPQNANNYFYYGDNYYRAEKPDSAKIMFQKGLGLDPNNALCNVGMGKLLLDEVSLDDAKALKDQQMMSKAQGNIAEANALFQKALDATKMKDATVLSEVAEALTQSKNKDLPRALDLLNKAITLDGKNTLHLIRAGNAYIEQRNGNMAAEYFNKALDLDAKNLRAILQKGILYYRSTNYDAAGAEFKRAIAIDPSFAPAHRQMGETYWKQNKVDLALQEYNKYLEINKGSENARTRYIAFLYLIKQYKESLAEINKLPKFDSTSAMLSRIGGYSSFETGDSLGALKFLQHVFDIVPEEKRLSADYKYYGNTLIKTGQDSLGITYLMHASALDSTDTEMMNEVATQYYRLKKYGEAAEWYRKMIDAKAAKGELVRANDYFLLGKAYFFNSDLYNADTAFAKLNEVSPKYLSGFQWRAQNLARIDSTGEEGLAKPAYEKIIELIMADSTNSTKNCSQLLQAYQYMASYYAIKKDNANVIEYLKKQIALPCCDEKEKARLKKIIDQILNPPQQQQGNQKR